jgi:hypothetical protein
MGKRKIMVWESDGCLFGRGEVPVCSFCERTAADPDAIIWETPVSGVYVCGSEECCQAFIEQEGSPFVLVEEEEEVPE